MFQIPIKKQMRNKNQQFSLLMLIAIKQNRIKNARYVHNFKIKMMNKMNKINADKLAKEDQEEAAVQEEEAIVQEEEPVVQEEEAVVQEEEAVVQEEEPVVQEEEAVVQEEVCIDKNSLQYIFANAPAFVFVNNV